MDALHARSMNTPLPRSTRAVAVPLAGMLFTQASAVMSLVTVAVSLIATVNLLRIPRTTEP